MSIELWHNIAIDFLIDLSIEEGLISLLVVVGCISKITHIVPLKK